MVCRRTMTSVLVALVLCLPDAGKGAQAAASLVRNGDFEELDSAQHATYWWYASDTWTVDAGVHHQGSHSMRISNPDAADYNVCVQEIPLTPGSSYDISVWIKTSGVQGGSASIYLEWYGPKGWIGGYYPAGLEGTNGWQHLTFVSTPVDAAATRAVVGLLLYQGVTGTAWFDQVEVKWHQPPLLTVRLDYPNCHGYFVDGWAESAAALTEVTLAPSAKHPLSTLVVLEQLLDSSGSTRASATIDPVTATNLPVRLALPSDLPLGSYRLRVAVLSRGSAKPLSETSYALQKISSEQALSLPAFIRADNVMLVSGKPFFPLGVYEVVNPQESAVYMPRLRQIAEGSFNTVLNYCINCGTYDQTLAYVAAAHGLGLKTIFAAENYNGVRGNVQNAFAGWPGDSEEERVQNAIRALGTTPGMLAWYICDEINPKYGGVVQKRYRDILTLDPNHPSYLVHWDAGQLSQLIASGDALGMDPYPVPDIPITYVSQQTRKTVRMTANHRPAWMVIQAFSWEDYDRPGRRPTAAEERNMAYQALVNGARGLIFYSYFDIVDHPHSAGLWPIVRAVAAQVRQLSPALLQSTLSLGVTMPAPLMTLAKPDPDDAQAWFLLAVNPLRSAATLTLPLPHVPKRITVLFEGRSITTTEAGFTDAFAPLDVHVYRIVDSQAVQSRMETTTVGAKGVCCTDSNDWLYGGDNAAVAAGLCCQNDECCAAGHKWNVAGRSWHDNVCCEVSEDCRDHNANPGPQSQWCQSQNPADYRKWCCVGTSNTCDSCGQCADCAPGDGWYCSGQKPQYRDYFSWRTTEKTAWNAGPAAAARIRLCPTCSAMCAASGL